MTALEGLRQEEDRGTGDDEIGEQPVRQESTLRGASTNGSQASTRRCVANGPRVHSSRYGLLDLQPRRSDFTMLASTKTQEPPGEWSPSPPAPLPLRMRRESGAGNKGDWADWGARASLNLEGEG